MANKKISVFWLAGALGASAAVYAAEPATAQAAKATAMPPAAVKRPPASAEAVSEQMAEMQAQIAVLDIQIKLAEKQQALAKLLAGGERPKSDLAAALPPADAPAAAEKTKKRQPTPVRAAIAPPLPTYDSIDGLDGKMSVTLVLNDGTVRQYGIGEGEQDWRIVSIALNQITVQQGKNKVALKKDEGTPKGNSSAIPGNIPGLGQLLPPPVLN